MLTNSGLRDSPIAGFDEEEEELSKQATPLRARLAELE
jgi:hypothetical protein